MTHKTHDLAVKVGEYTDKNGEKRGKYQNVGAVMMGDKGPFIMLAKWFNPAGVTDSRGGESILISVFEPRQDGQQASAPQPAESQKNPMRTGSASGFDDMDSSIPF